jgi:hypothetical protein
MIPPHYNRIYDVTCIAEVPLRGVILFVLCFETYFFEVFNFGF